MITLAWVFMKIVTSIIFFFNKIIFFFENDQNLEYTYDFERDDQATSNAVKKAQQGEDCNHEDDCNHRYKLPKPKVFHSFSTKIYNNYQNSKKKNIQMDKEWQLLYRVQGKVMYNLLDGFFAELYFNTENHYLLLVIKGTSSIGNVWSDIKNVGLGLKGGELDSAFTFGEKVRVLMNKFKCKPMLLITGHSLGGYLAQIITYTITYCFVNENGKVESRKEPMDDFGIYTVVFDSPAAYKQISSIAQRDPLQLERFRLPIVNFITDVNIINCNSKIGPHLGLIILVNEFKDLNTPSTWIRICRAKSTHKIKNFENIDLQQCQQVEFLPSKITVKYEEKEIQNCFFSSKNFERLEKYKFHSAMFKALVNRLPNFKISNSCIFIQDEKVSAEEFIAKAHFFLSQFKEKLDNGTYDGKNNLDKTLYELWNAQMRIYAHNFCMNEKWKGLLQVLRDGTKIGGFKSFEEMRFAACLIHNSFQRCIYFNYDQFIAVNPNVLEDLTSTTEAMLILIVKEKYQSITHQGGEKLKILYLVLDEDTEVKLTFKLTALEETSQKYLKNTELDFLGNKVNAVDIFGPELLEKLSIWEVLNFYKRCVPTPNHSYSDQKISGRKFFNSAVTFARELMKKEMQFVLISSDAGMGKSTALRQIALTLQQELPNHWIVLVNLVDIQSELSESKDILSSKEAAVEFIRNLELKDRMSDEVLIKVFNCKLLNNQMIISIDSFDEVCPDHRETVENFISLLRETKLLIILTTRPHEGKKFNYAHLFELKTLDKKEIKKFIFEKFKILGKKPPSDPEGWLDKICDRDNFWSLPLNLNMVTSMYARDIAGPSGLIGNKNILQVFLTKSIDDTLNFKFNVKKKGNYAASMQTHTKCFKEIYDLHEVLAFCLTFHGGKMNNLKSKELKVKIKKHGENINRFDIAKLDKKYENVSFSHRSYADNLSANSLLRCYQKDFNCHELKPTKKQLKRFYFANDLRDVRKQVCQILAGSPSLTMVFDQDYINGNNKTLLIVLLVDDCYEIYLQLKKRNISFRLEIIADKHSLYIALLKARKEFVQELIKDGARFEDILNEKGVLHLAIQKGLHQEVKDNFDSLKINMDLEHNGNLPLHFAAECGSTDIAKFLINQGAKVEAKNKLGYTALFSAIEANNAEVCELMIKEQADCTDAFIYAVEYGRMELLEVIYKKAPSGCTAECVKEAHFEAVKHGKPDIFNHICGLPEANPLAVNSNGDTFLHCAAEKGHLHCMPFIFEYMNQSVDVRNRNRETALMRALQYGHEDVVNWLLGQKADILAVDGNGYSCLLWAARVGNVYFVDMCLAAGADINSQDNDGGTALYHASQCSHINVVKSLLEKGAKHEISDNDGNMCLHTACYHTQL